jgi:hypothetical protein
MSTLTQWVKLAIIIGFLVGCATPDIRVDEIVAPTYSAIDSAAAVALEPNSAQWRASPLSRARAQATDGQFVTFGPGSPRVFIDANQVVVLEFHVVPGDESTVTAHLTAFDLDSGRTVHRAVRGQSQSIARSVARPSDLTEADIEPLVAAYSADNEVTAVEVLLLEDVAGDFYRRVQAVAPHHDVFLFLESDRLDRVSYGQSFVGRFASTDVMFAAVQSDSSRARLAAYLAGDTVASGEQSDPAPPRRAETIDLGEVEADEAGIATVDVPGGTYTGEVVDGRPDGQGRIEYVDGRVYEGGFREGAFHGQAILTGQDGDTLEVTFNGGVPEGAGEYRFGQEAYEVSYSDGIRTDARYLERIVPNYREIQRQRDELTAAVREGLPESAFAANASAIEGLRAQLDGDTGPERLLFQFQIEDQVVRFQLNDDGLVVSRFEEIRVEDDNGELLAVYRAGDTLAITDQGAALRIAREELERLEEPRESVTFRTLVGGGGMFVGRNVFFGGANFGADYRYMNNSGDFLPGLPGGNGRGWDYRGTTALRADYQRITYDFGDETQEETEFTLSFNGAASVGRTTYTFEPADRQTLEQEGRGRTWGLQLLYSYQLVRPEPPPPPEGIELFPALESLYERLTRRWRILPVPFFSIETYRYSPGAVRLESRVTEFQLLIGGGVGLFVTTTLNSF